MAWSESKAWNKGTLNQKLYQALLDDATEAPARNAKRKKIVHPEDMPWEMARQGLLKHLVNEAMNTRLETVDAYMQIIPPGSRSGKHRHLAEECLYVVEGHGYNHEIARYLPRDQEDTVMKRAIAMIQQRTGRRPLGWRSCTQSTNTLELLIENGFTFNTNCFHEELPFLYENNGKVIVELPRQPFGDGTLFGHRHGEYGNPYHGLETWKAYFDELYSESTPEKPKYIPFTMHPYIIGRPGRTLALRGILHHMKAAGNLWFPTGIDLAEYCLNNLFKAECQKLQASAG